MKIGLGMAFALLVVATAAQAETPLERGTYLVNSIMGCGNCHTPQGPKGPLPGMDLAGGMEFKDQGMLAYSGNITQDKETGIGSWTDAQIATAIREGKRPDGTLIGPPMPFGQYRNISDSDIAAVVAYLRTVKPIANKVKASKYDFPLPPAWGPPVTSVPDVPRDNKLAYGAYLAGPLGHCVECHTPMNKDMTFDFEHRKFAGGLEIRGPWGLSLSANITPDKETGIGKWTDAQIKRAITQGIDDKGTPLNPPMGFSYYAKLKPADLDAIVAYLRSVKPVHNEVH